MNDIGVFYLARLAEGFDIFERFANSYRNHPAGTGHEVVVIAKGFKRKTELAVLAEIFKGIPHEITIVEDDIGQDIQSYKAAAARFRQPLMCFMNTFTVLKSDNWLKKLTDAMSQPDVGMVGASGSLESLYNSWELITRAHFHVTAPGAFDPEISRAFDWTMSSWSPSTYMASRSRYRRLRRHIGDIRGRRPKFTPQTIEKHRHAFVALLGRNGPLSHLTDFPYFPNPHIRSNVFLIRREDFLKAPLKKGSDKINACLFESGSSGMSRRFLERGKKILVVGADARAYDIPEWSTCRCFRSGDQSNLLATDNQATAFDKMTDGDRKTHLTMTWGEYLPGGRKSLFGVPFDAFRPLSGFSKPRQRQVGPEPLLSIVIPTHDRRELVLSAIKTVRAQNYQNWELSIFDNASREPIANAIDALRDQRIRCERSDTKLAVTDSWNRAIDMARGDYVTLIGDDDGLAPGFFKRIAELVDDFERPDAIYSSLYQFFHPMVLPGHPLGLVRSLPTASFFNYRDYPFLLDKQTRDACVENSLKIRRTFMFNMPAFTVRRDFLDSLRRNGKLLQPPFPDYYFANLVFVKAKTVVAEPHPLCFQGVSRPSFGFTLLNKTTDDGFKVLGHEVEPDANSESAAHLLPGPGYQTQYIQTMARVSAEMSEQAIKPDYRRYRAIQIFNQIKDDAFVPHWSQTQMGSLFWRHMTASERQWAKKILGLHRLKRLAPRFVQTRLDQVRDDLDSLSFKPLVQTLAEGSFVDGFELYQGIESGQVRPFRC